MKLTKPMLRAFTSIVHGENTVAKVAHALHKSTTWMDNVVHALEDEGFITKRSNFALRGSRFLLEVAPTPHALKLKELLFAYHGISFENILTEGRLLFLAALSEDWMTTETTMKLSRISKYSVERYRPVLLKRGVLKRKKNLYTINEKAWLLLKEFLRMYKNYAIIDGQVRWKYHDEMLFQVNSEKLIRGSATGFYAYRQYGVEVGVVSALCFLPQKKLSQEEIFVHSLFEVEDPRTLHLALTFYLKNKLAYAKIMPLAMKYGKYTMFEKFVKLFKTKEEKVKTEGLPAFDRKDFIRIAHIYGVENV